MESKTTIFYVGEETKPVVENLKRLKESIFSYHIDKSIHLIDEHLSVDPKEAMMLKIMSIILLPLSVNVVLAKHRVCALLLVFYKSCKTRKRIILVLTI